MGMAVIAAFLNNSGYKKKLRQNNTIEGFSTSFVKGVLDNPIYCGKLAFGRRKNEKIPGTRNKYHIVKQNYLEKGIKKNYYNPVDIGEERELKKVYEWIMKHID